jgi:hypothetical protein
MTSWQLPPSQGADPRAGDPRAEKPRAGELPGDERHAGFRPVECDHCGARVLVAKFSPQHTSVQWDSASVRACAEFRARAATGEQSALIDTCASLRASIGRAVSQDRLPVRPP